jgi:AcrR family transcriptional regulator
MTKHDLKKAEIIKYAFSEWGKSGFQVMSLSVLASKMKLSKTAFYRYFNCKDKIIDEMMNLFIEEYLKIMETSIKDYDKLSLNDFLFNYIKTHFTFFAENQHYLHFFSFCTMKTCFSENIKYTEMLKYHTSVFKTMLSKEKTIIPIENADTFIRYIYSTGIFVLFFNIKQKKNKKDIIDFTAMEIENNIKLIYDISTKGFGTETINDKIDFTEIEKQSSIIKEEIPERNKIFNAITNVVAREGIWNTSIDKIAKEAGMSKSNFYFYFKNKEEMLGNLITQEIETIFSLIKNRNEKYQSFEEKLYSELIVSASILKQDKKIMYFFNWLHFQRIDLKNLKKVKKMECLIKERFGNLMKAIEDGKLNIYSFDIDFIVSFLNMQVVKEILLAHLTDSEDQFKEIRIIYKLFLTGLYERSK